MFSIRTRVALAAGKYVVTHPRGRIARWVIRLAVWAVLRRLRAFKRVGGTPRIGGLKLATAGGVVLTAGGTLALVRRSRSRRGGGNAAVGAREPAPFPPAAAPVAPQAAAPPGGPGVTS